MITVKQGVGDTLLVYNDHVYCGTINLIKANNQLIYQAVSKNGKVLGSNPVYGSALSYLVGKPFVR